MVYKVNYVFLTGFLSLNTKERLKYLSKNCKKFILKREININMLFSSKVTHSVLKFLESNGLDSERLYSLINTPEEFLKDPSSWQPARNIEFFLAKSESLFKETIKSDQSFIQCVGHKCAQLKSWGVLDSVLKMIKHPSQFYAEPTNFLSYFISPTPSITQLQINTSSQFSFNLSFSLDFEINDYPHFVSYFIAVLEALPTYLNHNLAHVSWKNKHINITWKDHQTSFFPENKKILDQNFKNLNHPLESLTKDKKLITKQESSIQKTQSLLKQLHLSQNDPNIENQKNDLEQLDTWEKLTNQLVSKINPYILKSINNTQKLKDYFVRARQILTILIGQEKHRTYIKDSMKRMNWDFVTQEFSSTVEQSMQDLLKINEALESLLIKEPQKTKVDLNLLLTTIVNDLIGHKTHIAVDYHLIKIKKIIVFHQHLRHAFIHLIRASVPHLNNKGFIKISTHLKNKKVIEIEILSRGFDQHHQKHRDIHLSIAHWLIRMHNGKISLQEYFNKETLFLVHLPIGA